ncbi:hypothetical protein MTP03_21650 [Tsukamurella sp. PLM1]|nr:hypothetical protein MTP03_21650 [Tsukamurella sp. PLM1]
MIALAPTVRRAGLRGGLLNWDGQLTDDARLTVGIARTAASHGATILTHCGATQVTGTAATVTDELTGHSFTLRARAVVNATGVWSGTVDPAIRLRPSRGTHLVFRQESFGGLTAGLTVPVPHTFGRYVFALPQPDGRVYVGLTDIEADGPLPDVPTPSADEIDFLLATVNLALGTPLTRDDVVGAFAGLRPLLDSGAGQTADVSRKHAVLTRGDGLVTVVGGKLTTYRRMAQDAVDAALAASAWRPAPASPGPFPGGRRAAGRLAPHRRPGTAGPRVRHRGAGGPRPRRGGPRPRGARGSRHRGHRSRARVRRPRRGSDDRGRPPRAPHAPVPHPAGRSSSGGCRAGRARRSVTVRRHVPRR